MGIAKIQSSKPTDAKKLDVPNKGKFDQLAKSLPKATQQTAKMSIHDEIKRQSTVFVTKLSLAEKSKLLTRPYQHLEAVKMSVRSDKSSILSGSMGGENAKIIDQRSMQESIVRGSLKMIVPAGKKSLFDLAVRVKRSVKSKLCSPPPKQMKSGAGRVIDLSNITPMKMFGVEAATTNQSKEDPNSVIFAL